MEAAFLHLVLLPPPAASPLVLAGCRGARAGCAADRGVPGVVKRVVGQVVLADVVPDLVLRPGSKRRDLGQAGVLLIGRHDRGLCARWSLLPAQARHPCVVPDQGARQGPRLSYLAAQAPHLHSLEEEVAAVASAQTLHIAPVGDAPGTLDPLPFPAPTI